MAEERLWSWSSNVADAGITLPAVWLAIYRGTVPRDEDRSADDGYPARVGRYNAASGAGRFHAHLLTTKDTVSCRRWGTTGRLGVFFKPGDIAGYRIRSDGSSDQYGPGKAGPSLVEGDRSPVITYDGESVFRTTSDHDGTGYGLGVNRHVAVGTWTGGGSRKPVPPLGGDRRREHDNHGRFGSRTVTGRITSREVA